MNTFKKIPEQELINELVANGIVKQGHFKLTSGRHSDTYIQKDEIILNPDLRTTIINHFCKVICPGITPGVGPRRVEVIVGPIMGALPFAALVADKLQLPLVYPDRDNQGRISFKRGFDRVIAVKNVYIIEDIVTTGTSWQTLRHEIDCLGGEVVGVSCIWNRGSDDNPEYFSAIINKEVISYGSSCPLCDKGVPLTDPKTMQVVV